MRGGRQRIDNCDAVEESLVCPLEETDRQHDPQLARDRAEVAQCAILVDGGRESQVAVVLLDAEIRRLEQLLQQDDLRALTRRPAHQRFSACDVRIDIPVAGELRGRDRDLARRGGEMGWLHDARTPECGDGAVPAV